jgi:diguanylate cyclase (GGDEF)-like protein
MASSTSQVLYIAFLVQAAGALLTALVLSGFHRQYRKGHLHCWTLSWFALGLTEGAVVAAISAESTGWYRAALAVAVLARMVQIGGLVLGAYELGGGREVTRRMARTIFGSLLALGAVVALLGLSIPRDRLVETLARTGGTSVGAGLAFLGSAAWIWRGSRRRRGIGHVVVCTAFALYGLKQIPGFGQAIEVLLGRSDATYALFLGFSDFLLQSLIALGMAAWLLEDERQAAQDAARQVQHLAFHDALTGLPNRQLFLDRLGHALAQATRNQHQLAVFFLDLDRFKVINDSLGHSVGDQLLQMVAQRMTAALRRNDTVTRQGGDEFTILAPKLKGADDAIMIARKVKETLAKPFVINGRELFVTTSIGIALFPSDGEDAETLLRHADLAMYGAKARGRDGFQLYTSSMNEHAQQQLSLESSLRRAVAAKELVVHYQPIVAMAGGRVEGVEVLVRWHDREHGMVSPDRFIPLAEQMGLIGPIGEYVLRTATAQLASWHARGHTHLRVAINISVRQLQTSDFVPLVAEVLGETGLPARALEFEVTENVTMQRDDAAVERLRELKALGVRLSVDDFGTGHSSLSTLRLFPLDAVKIDRSFVRDLASDPEDAVIAKAVIALAHSLNLPVIAEGVERVEQLEMLRREECDAWQGYLFCAPVTAEEVERVIGVSEVARREGMRTGEVAAVKG